MIVLPHRGKNMFYVTSLPLTWICQTPLRGRQLPNSVLLVGDEVAIVDTDQGPEVPHLLLRGPCIGSEYPPEPKNRMPILATRHDIYCVTSRQ